MTMQAAQQTEVYWMALTRDVPFSQYANDGLIQVAAGKRQNVTACMDSWLGTDVVRQRNRSISRAE